MISGNTDYTLLLWIILKLHVWLGISYSNLSLRSFYFLIDRKFETRVVHVTQHTQGPQYLPNTYGAVMDSPWMGLEVTGWENLSCLRWQRVQIMLKDTRQDSVTIRICTLSSKIRTRWPWRLEDSVRGPVRVKNILCHFKWKTKLP